MVTLWINGESENGRKTGFWICLHPNCTGNVPRKEATMTAYTFQGLFSKIQLAVDLLFMQWLHRTPNVGTVLWEESEGQEPVRLDSPLDLERAENRCTNFKRIHEKHLGIVRTCVVLDIFIREPAHMMVVHRMLAFKRPHLEAVELPEEQVYFDTTISDLPEEMLIYIFQHFDVFSQRRLREVCKLWHNTLSLPACKKRITIVSVPGDRKLYSSSLVSPLAESITADFSSFHWVGRINRERFIVGSDSFLEAVLQKCPSTLKIITLSNVRWILADQILELSGHIPFVRLRNVLLQVDRGSHFSMCGSIFAYFENVTIEWGENREANLITAIENVLRDFLGLEPFSMMWISEGFKIVCNNNFAQSAVELFNRTEKHLRDLEKDNLYSVDLRQLRPSTLCHLATLVFRALEVVNTLDEWADRREYYHHLCNSQPHVTRKCYVQK